MSTFAGIFVIMANVMITLLSLGVIVLLPLSVFAWYNSISIKEKETEKKKKKNTEEEEEEEEEDKRKRSSSSVSITPRKESRSSSVDSSTAAIPNRRRSSLTIKQPATTVIANNFIDEVIPPPPVPMEKKLSKREMIQDDLVIVEETAKAEDVERDFLSKEERRTRKDSNGSEYSNGVASFHEDDDVDDGVEEPKTPVIVVFDDKEPKPSSILKRPSSFRPRKSMLSISSNSNSPMLTHLSSKKSLQFSPEEISRAESPEPFSITSNASPEVAPIDLTTSTSTNPDDEIRHITTFRCHSDCVRLVAFSPDDWFIATAGSQKDRSVKVWTRSSLFELDSENCRVASKRPPKFTTIKLDPDCASAMSFPIGHVTLLVIATQDSKEIRGYKIPKTPGMIPKIEFSFKTMLQDQEEISFAYLHLGHALHFDDPSMYVISASTKSDSRLIQVWGLGGNKLSHYDCTDSVKQLWLSPNGTKIIVAHENYFNILNVIRKEESGVQIVSRIEQDPSLNILPMSFQGRIDVKFEIHLDDFLQISTNGMISIVAYSQEEMLLKRYEISSMSEPSTMQVFTYAAEAESDIAFPFVGLSRQCSLLIGSNKNRIHVLKLSDVNSKALLHFNDSTINGNDVELISISEDGSFLAIREHDSNELSLFALPFKAPAQASNKIESVKAIIHLSGESEFL